MNVAELNSRFAANDHVEFRQLADGVLAVAIDNNAATALISLHGAHVVSWQPKHQPEPVLWTSELATFAPGTAIRGGVPICWPWFGAHPTDKAMPLHGFARISRWDVGEIVSPDSGSTMVTLSMLAHQSNPSFQLDSSSLSVRVSVGESLSIDLETSNQGSHNVQFTEALHTYFYVGDISKTRVVGVEHDEYADLVRGSQGHREAGPVRFEGELGRLYVNSDAAAEIEDPVLGRRIRVCKTGSLSTAVWNPGAARAAAMGEFTPDGWKRMVCVESANAMGNIVTLPGGASHTLGVVYSVESTQTLPSA